MQIILPILITFVRALSTAASYVAAFSQALFGSNQAQQTVANNNQIANSMGNIAKEAEKAKGSLMGFDEINQLNYQEASDIPSPTDVIPVMAGGGSGLVDAMSNITDEVRAKIENLVESVKQKLHLTYLKLS